MNELLDKIYSDKDFIALINDIISNPTVRQMESCRQHYDTSCFDHCLAASYYCYIYCKKLNLDYTSCARAAMLHDLFLYDWHKRQYNRHGFHAFTHPKTAYMNASKLFNLNDKETDIILKHMWPVTLSLPKYKESYLLTFVDKYCALNEFMSGMCSRVFRLKFLRYAYVFLCLLCITR